jgi:hypothetical protein
MDERITRTYKVSSYDERHLNALENVFSLMEYLGSVGHSTEIRIFVDGDGAMRLKFTDENNQKIKEHTKQEEIVYPFDNEEKVRENKKSYFIDLG